MSEIYVKFMVDELVETMKSNLKTVTEYINSNPINSSWISKIYSSTAFVEKNYKVKDFSLDLSETGNYKEVDYNNSIKLYESLKGLPNYIYSDERFWAWLNFDKFYQQALQAMPVKNKVSTVRDHYLFRGSSRRGLFFGVLSRCFFRVYLSVDETLADKYELTKFVIDNPERIRNLTWRLFSSQKHLVLGVLKAEKKLFDEFGDEIPNSTYAEIAKYVSKVGSVRLLDALQELDIENIVYSKFKNQLNSIKGEK